MVAVSIENRLGVAILRLYLHPRKWEIKVNLAGQTGELQR